MICCFPKRIVKRPPQGVVEICHRAERKRRRDELLRWHQAIAPEKKKEKKKDERARRSLSPWQEVFIFLFVNIFIFFCIFILFCIWFSRSFVVVVVFCYTYRYRRIVSFHDANWIIKWHPSCDALRRVILDIPGFIDFLVLERRMSTII